MKLCIIISENIVDGDKALKMYIVCSKMNTSIYFKFVCHFHKHNFSMPLSPTVNLAFHKRKRKNFLHRLRETVHKDNKVLAASYPKHT